jgi:hypothetical protein
MHFEVLLCRGAKVLFSSKWEPPSNPSRLRSEMRSLLRRSNLLSNYSKTGDDIPGFPTPRPMTNLRSNMRRIRTRNRPPSNVRAWELSEDFSRKSFGPTTMLSAGETAKSFSVTISCFQKTTSSSSQESKRSTVKRSARVLADRLWVTMRGLPASIQARKLRLKAPLRARSDGSRSYRCARKTC